MIGGAKPGPCVGRVEGMEPAPNRSEPGQNVHPIRGRGPRFERGFRIRAKEQIMGSFDEIVMVPHFACIGVARGYELPALRGGS